MRLYFTRRNFLTTGIGALVSAAEFSAQSEAIPLAGVPITEVNSRSTVALTTGADRRKNVYQALVAIDDQLRPRLKAKKRILIKANNVGGGRNPLACTHADALRGMLDYLAPRFNGPITIGEVSAGQSNAFEDLGYPQALREYKGAQVDLVDFTREDKWVLRPMLDQDA